MSIVDKIFTEWRYKTSNGVPNINNPLHEANLRNILRYKYGMSDEAANAVINSMIQELDLVKNKDTGNVYTVKKANRDKHDVVKKNASSDDIKQAADKDSDDSISNVDDIDTAPFPKGKMTLNVGGKMVHINAGKGDKKFRQRIKNLMKNDTFLQNADTFTSLTDSFDNGNMEEAQGIIKSLQDMGVQVNLVQIRTGAGKKSNQIRIGTTPFYTFEGKPDEDDALKNEAESLMQLGVTKQKAGTSDSPHYKPDTFFPNDDANFTFDKDDDVREDLKNSTFHNIGKGDEVLSNVASRIDNIVKNNSKNYSSDELKGLQEFSDVLKNPNSSVEDLEAAYQKLLGSSINRSNEIHKNFGEIYAGIILAKENPNSSVLLPAAGNATLSDVVLVHPQDGEVRHIVEEVAVKAKGKGVPSSLVSVNSGLVWNRDGNEPSEIEKQIQTVFLNATGKGFRELKTNPEGELAQTVSEVVTSILLNDEVRGVITDRADYIERLIGRPVNDIPGDLAPHELMAIATRDQKVFSQIFMSMIVPNVDAEATGKKLSVTEVAENGEVASHPVIIDDLKVSGPKRFGEVATIFLTSG